MRPNEPVQPIAPDFLIGVPEAARIAGAHPHTIRAAIHRGDLPARLFARQFLIDVRDLRKWSPRRVGRPSK